MDHAYLLRDYAKRLPVAASALNEAADEIDRLKTAAQSVCDVVDAWDLQDMSLVALPDVLTLVQPLREKR